MVTVAVTWVEAAVVTITAGAEVVGIITDGRGAAIAVGNINRVSIWFEAASVGGLFQSCQPPRGFDHVGGSLPGFRASGASFSANRN
jgi:hypothetical protein